MQRMEKERVIRHTANNKLPRMFRNSEGSTVPYAPITSNLSSGDHKGSYGEIYRCIRYAEIALPFTIQ